MMWLQYGCGVAVARLQCGCGVVMWLRCGCGVAVMWLQRGCGVAVMWLVWCSVAVVWLSCVYPVFIALPSDAGQVSTHRLLLLQLLLPLRHPADQRLQRAQQVLPLLCASLQAPPETHNTG